MEDLLSKALLQSGLGVIGVLALLYMLREVTKLQRIIDRLLRKTNRIDTRIAVILHHLKIQDPVGDEDDDG